MQTDLNIYANAKILVVECIVTNDFSGSCFISSRKLMIRPISNDGMIHLCVRYYKHYEVLYLIIKMDVYRRRAL